MGQSQELRKITFLAENCRQGQEPWKAIFIVENCCRFFFWIVMDNRVESCGRSPFSWRIVVGQG
jgi:hypothetical protein